MSVYMVHFCYKMFHVMGMCPFICWVGFLVLASSLGDSGCLSFHRMISTARTDWWHTVLFPESSQCPHSVQQTRTSGPSAGSHRQFADNLKETQQVKTTWQVIQCPMATGCGRQQLIIAYFQLLSQIPCQGAEKNGYEPHSRTWSPR